MSVREAARRRCRRRAAGAVLAAFVLLAAGCESSGEPIIDFELAAAPTVAAFPQRIESDVPAATPPSEADGRGYPSDEPRQSQPSPTAAATPSPAPTPAAPPTAPMSEVAPVELGSSPELQELADACYVGLMLSCDRLFSGAASGSLYERYGSSCGERIEPVGACVELFTSTDARIATLIADGVLLRAGPSLSAAPLVKVEGFVGNEVPVLETSPEGWTRTVVLGTDGWLFSGFLLPAPDGFAIARTLDREPAELLDEQGRPLGRDNPSGSFVLVEPSSVTGDLIPILLPDGGPARVDRSTIEFVSRGN